jgi:Tol biopolymer transport system component
MTQAFSWSPDGKKIAFHTRSASALALDIYVVNADGSGQKNLTNSPDSDSRPPATLDSDSGPSWSPDGKKIAFRSYRDGNYEIYVMNADGSEPKRLTNSPDSDLDPSWSPDGKKIAFTSSTFVYRDIYVMNADGSEQKRLTNSPGSDLDPSWSPDGKKIAFYSGSARKQDIYVMNADGSEQKNLTNSPAMDENPSWSPDGTKIAFVSTGDLYNDIHVMNVDGSEQKKLTNNSVFNDDLSCRYEDPSWSPDGKKITFTSSTFASRDIYVMNADGSEQKKLRNSPDFEINPCWSPFLSEESKEVQD